MRRYGGPDVQGLASAGNWRDPPRAVRMWSRARNGSVDNLPDMGTGRGKKPPTKFINQING